MKFLFLILFCFGTTIVTSKNIAIDENNFPDANFRNYLLNQSYGTDKVLSDTEIAGITSIKVDYKEIKSLKGIEVFSALTILRCSGNQLTSIDVSQNTALTKLYCMSNHLTSLNVSENMSLTTLLCGNNQLASLDLLQNTLLSDLYCGHNQLSSLDLSQNTALTSLSCEDNQLTTLDLSENIALQSLSCQYNQLTTLDLSGNIALQSLYCQNNQLSSLDLSGKIKLEYLFCNNNHLTSLNVYGCSQLTGISCYCNKIKDECMTEFVNSLPGTSDCGLRVVYNNDDEENSMTTIQVASARNKGWIPYYYNNTWQKYEGEAVIVCEINEKNFPDVNFRNWILSQNYGMDGVLKDKEIEGIIAIDVNNKNIESLQGIEYFTSLKKLDCYCNQIKDDALNRLIDELPNASNRSIHFIYNENEGNVMTFKQAAAAKVKGWTPMYFDGNDWHTYYGIEPIVLRGDVNGDGEIGMPDVMFIVNYILGTPTETFNADAADVNGDGEIGMSDVMYIVQYILNGLYPSGGLFYLGTVKPTKDNYKSLSGMMTSYISILDAVGNNFTVPAGETLYMLCPVSWMENKSIALEDENGNTFYFSDIIEKVFISGIEYNVYKILTSDDSNNVKLKTNSITNNSVAAIIDSDPYVKIYTEALKLTKLNAIMDKYEDMEYRKKYEKYKDNLWATEALSTGSRAKENVYYPEHRYYGFTAFMVKDNTLEKYNSVLANHQFNASGSIDENILALAELASKYYTTSVPYTSTDYANPEHPMYKFMAYHLLDRNVQGYNFLTVREDAGIDKDIVNPTDWYTTCLPHSMIKVEHLTVAKWVGSGMRGHYYINRNYNDKKYVDGIHVQPAVSVQDNNAANGIYFYVDDILIFDDKTKNDVFNTRIRMDFSTIFPEIMTNEIRMNGPSITGSNVGKNYRFPQGYLAGVTLNNEDTRLIYWYAKSGYYSMNGDEMDAQNMYDITFTLPPVPFTGEWEIRLGFAPMNVQNDGADWRGPAQIYFDDIPQGIPLDFSKTLAEVYGISARDWSSITYSDLRQDNEKRLEDFKILKNRGYYRGPHSVFNSSNGLISGKYNTFSQMRNTARIVLCKVHIDAEKSHTLRIKNIMSGDAAKIKEAMLDYLELVPKSIYEISEGENVEDDL